MISAKEPFFGAFTGPVLVGTVGDNLEGAAIAAPNVTDFMPARTDDSVTIFFEAVVPRGSGLRIARPVAAVPVYGLFEEEDTVVVLTPKRCPSVKAAVAFAGTTDRAGGGDGLLVTVSRDTKCDCLIALLGIPVLAESPSALRFEPVVAAVLFADKDDIGAEGCPVISARRSPI